MLLVMPSCDGDGIAGVMSARAYRAGCVEAEPCPNVKRWIIIGTSVRSDCFDVFARSVRPRYGCTMKLCE